MGNSFQKWGSALRAGCHALAATFWDQLGIGVTAKACELPAATSPFGDKQVPTLRTDTRIPAALPAT
jgi:hypothetical protein